MLNLLPLVRSRIRQRAAFPARQNGVVLVISLIILVALTIAGLALVRSVDTTNVIAGNLAFQQAAVAAGEAGTEAAISTFLDIAVPSDLEQDIASKGYTASTTASGNPASWDTYWSDSANSRVTLATDTTTGNKVSYMIQRLCQTAGAPDKAPTGCASYTPAPEACYTAGCNPLAKKEQYYYRITTRIDGPRNSLAYIQAIVTK